VAVPGLGGGDGGGGGEQRRREEYLSQALEQAKQALNEAKRLAQLEWEAVERARMDNEDDEDDDDGENDDDEEDDIDEENTPDTVEALQNKRRLTGQALTDLAELHLVSDDNDGICRQWC